MWLRLRHGLSRRSTGVALALVAYGGVCLVLFCRGGLVGLIALVPLLVLPLLGGLAYWLLWHEYHR
jgi:hypothetical protein